MTKDPPRGALLARISAIHLGWKRILQKNLAPWGISPKQIHLLKLLDRRGFLSPSEIAVVLHSDRPTVTTLLTTLTKAGWVALEADEGDRRRKRVVLAPGGRDLLGSVPPELWRSDVVDGDPTEALEPHERRELYRLLGKLLDSGQKGEADGSESVV